MSVAGVLLAAGAGRRAGGPKALRREDSGQSWVERGLRRLELAGCAPLIVVVGAEAERVSALVNDLKATPGGSRPGAASLAQVVPAPDWQQGMGASLCSGLRALQSYPPGQVSAALVMLVDLPDVTVEVLSRVLAAAAGEDLPAVLARAAYRAEPGHPVLIGRRHWSEVMASAVGDQGARGYLSTRAVTLIEAGDLATGRDVDGPPAKRAPAEATTPADSATGSPANPEPFD